MVLFLFFGAVLQNMVEKYEEEAVKSWIDRRLEQERLKDEERARKEQEALIAQAKAAVKEEEDLFF
jgi:hydrogenase maturation factor HypE